MSVRLTPVSGEGKDDCDTIQICNGMWAAITDLSEAFGEDVKRWNRCHDTIRYSPQELEAMARRVEQLKGCEDWLRWLAKEGGADLS